jgi:integrase
MWYEYNLVLVAACTGLRISEFAGLKWENLQCAD